MTAEEQAEALLYAWEEHIYDNTEPGWITENDALANKRQRARLVSLLTDGLKQNGVALQRLRQQRNRAVYLWFSTGKHARVGSSMKRTVRLRRMMCWWCARLLDTTKLEIPAFGDHRTGK